MTIHVDDFCWVGTSTFVNDVIAPLHKTFKIGTVHNTAFEYLGLELKHDDNIIIMSQNSYIEKIRNIPVDKRKAKTAPLN